MSPCWLLMTSDEEIVESLAILNEASVFLRMELGRGLRVRKVPHLRFHYDDSLKRGARINALIHQALKSDQTRLMGKSDKGRDVNGILVVDKPSRFDIQWRGESIKTVV